VSGLIGQRTDWDSISESNSHRDIVTDGVDLDGTIRLSKLASKRSDSHFRPPSRFSTITIDYMMLAQVKKSVCRAAAPTPMDADPDARRKRF
jgi:hypothetical protein